ncbi:MAG: hypothetical protein ACI38Q_00315 [Candidatus Bruticola sp.]
MRVGRAAFLSACILSNIWAVAVKADENGAHNVYLSQQTTIKRSVTEDGREVTDITIEQSAGQTESGNKAAAAKGKSGYDAVKGPPKDGNEGTYPTASSAAKRSGTFRVKDIHAPKDGNEGTYPQYRPQKAKAADSVKLGSEEVRFKLGVKPSSANSESDQPTGVVMPAPSIPAPSLGDPNFKYDSGVLTEPEPSGQESGVRTVVNSDSQEHSLPLGSSPNNDNVLNENGVKAVPRALSVPFVPKNVQTVTGSSNYPVSDQELKELLQDSSLVKTTPRYFIDNCAKNAEINKYAKAKVRYNVSSVKGDKLLLLAFHMPQLPDDRGRAAKAWILDGPQGIRTIDMRDLPTGVYQICSLSLNKDNIPTAKPNLDRFMVRYGGLEALADYEDRRCLLTGRIAAKPAGFADLELADAASEVPLFKIVPSSCVLRPGEHIVLTAEALPDRKERQLKRIHERYGLNGSEFKEPSQADQAGESKQKKRYVWAIDGRGRLEVVSDNSAVYYAPSYDTTGAQIICREEGSDNTATASVYVTTMPIGEMPRLEDIVPGSGTR